VSQDPPPQRKRKCRDCGQAIHIHREGDRKTLITEQQYERNLREARKRHQREVKSGFRRELREMQKLDIDQVEVLTCGDERVCVGCRALEGRRFSVADALESMPLPDDQCEMCRCVYIAVFDSSGPQKRSQDTMQTESSAGVGCASMISLGLIVVALVVLLVMA
jgi:hypothetical protein